ncbi:MAG: hypothetical protein COT43_02675 [Candidatus Marinimicrobia bacterium CG08_land_8_20_14_0_20_45_22]|nr:MAG: hypothetical protein COT43_02675 [Candidatus Marinimicrobia bacterium CG08_land_8_20_14_0_20_45_22]
MIFLGNSAFSFSAYNRLPLLNLSSIFFVLFRPFSPHFAGFRGPISLPLFTACGGKDFVFLSSLYFFVFFRYFSWSILFSLLWSLNEN